MPASLPGSRAVVGGLLVALAFAGLYGLASGAAATDHHPVLIAAVDLVPGTRLDPADLTVAEVDLPASTAARAFGVSETAALDGATVLAPVTAGELLQRSDLRTGDPADHETPVAPELSFPIDADRALAGALQAGERVDVLATWGTGSSALTEVIATDVVILAIGDRSSGSLADSGRVTLTVALPDAGAVLAVAHASQVGAVTLVRTGHDSDGAARRLDGVYRVEDGPATSGDATANDEPTSAGGDR